MIAVEARRANLRRLLRPRHIAMIGGKAIEGAISHARAIGYTGKIWPVNPRRANVLDLPCFPDVGSLPEAPDASFIAVPAGPTVEVVSALARRGAGGAVCFASGFAEAGHGALEVQLIGAAGDMAVLGPNCTGFANYLDRVAVSLGTLAPPAAPERGPALIAQSGNIGLNAARARRSLPFAYVMSVGNQAVTDIADLITVLAEDPRVTAIALYMEGLKRPNDFVVAVTQARRRGKPVVVLKGGRHALSARIAHTHTAAMISDDRLYDALFRRAGAVRVPTLSVLLETLKLHTFGGAPKGNRLAVLTCSGAESTLAADAALGAGFDLPNPSPAAATQLRKLLPSFGTVTNPLDYQTMMWGDIEAQARCIEMMLTDSYDAATLVVNIPWIENPDATPAIADWRAATQAAVMAERGATPLSVTFSLPEGAPDEERERLVAAGIAPLQGFDDAFLALAAAAKSKAFDAETDVTPLSSLPALPDGGELRTLDEWTSKRWLARHGIAVPEGRCVPPELAVATAGEIGFPVALKALSERLLHKTEAGAVALDLGDPEAVAQAATEMTVHLAVLPEPVVADRMLVERMAPSPVAELIVGVKRDQLFGFALAIGSGGILAELIGDITTLLLPTTEAEVRAALSRLKVGKLLSGYRGGPVADVDAAVAAIMAISQAALAWSDRLVELDVNPLFVLPAGQGAVAVDALATIVCKRSRTMEDLK